MKFIKKNSHRISMLPAADKYVGGLKKNLSTVVITSALFALSAPVVADLRVLVEYDQTEHRLLRVVELDKKPVLPQSTLGQTGFAASSNNRVTLRWFNADGVQISTSNIADPRLTHAPLSSDGQAPAVVGLSTGAYTMIGPSDSAVVEIDLPANVPLGLGAQTWRFELNP